MTATAIASTFDAGAPPIGRRIGGAIRNVLVLTRRNLAHIAREPLQLSDATVQPVLFTLLFVYVLGSGVPIAHGSYVDFALAGLVSLNLVTSANGTAVGLSQDLGSGVISRLRTLPIWNGAVLMGRSISDLLSATLCMTMVVLTGLLIGWRPDNSAGLVIGGFAIPLAFAYALSWASACLGMISKGPESAAGTGLVVLFPLAIVSNAMVPTQGMPGWLQAIADWNPVSAVTAATRTLWGNPNPSATVDAWPIQHPVIAALAWSALILAICAPTAVALYRRRTTD